MHVLVTGAPGFIGSHLARALLEQGFQVTGLSRARGPSKSFVSANNKARMVTCDITQGKNISEIFSDMDRIDCVFHLAGKTYRKNFEDPQSYFRNNFLGTLNLLECCRKFEVKKFIFSSSMAVYGVSPGWLDAKYLPVDEKHEVYPYDFYGCSKYCAEQICKLYHDRFGIISIVLRYSRVYGPNTNKGFVFETIKKALLNAPIEIFGNVSTDFVFVHDTVRANIEACKKISGFEIFNIGSGTEITLMDLCSQIVRLTRSTSPLQFHYERLKSRFFYDITKAKDHLRYRPTPLEKGLLQYINYVKGLIT